MRILIALLFIIVSAFTVVGCSNDKKVKATAPKPPEPVEPEPDPCPRCGQLLGSALGESFTNPFHSIQLSLDFHEDSSDPYKVQVLGDLYIKSFTSPACSIPAGKYKVTTTQAGVGSFTHLIGGLVLQASGPSQIELRGGEFIPDSIEQTSGCSGKSYSHGFSWTNGYLFSGGGTQCNYPITLDIPPRGRTFSCQ